MALTRVHHGELNKMNVPAGRYDELRREYAGDQRALQQIDVYDPCTEYNANLRELVTALRTRNDTSVLEAWFSEHYPGIGRAHMEMGDDATRHNLR
jgi:hypothetical protein